MKISLVSGLAVSKMPETAGGTMKRKAGRKKKKADRGKILICGIAGAAVVLLAVCVFWALSGGGKLNEIAGVSGEESVPEGSVPEEMRMSDGSVAGVMMQETVSAQEAEQFLKEMEGTQVKVEQQTLPEPSAETFREEEIQGYVKQTEKPARLTRDDIEIISVGNYSGIFVEDGSNDAVVDVASALVRNNSDEMLLAATFTFRVNDSETAEFVVSNLPAGTTALVQEKNRRTFSQSDVYVLEDDAYGMAENEQLQTDKFKVTGSDGMLTLENLTQQSYQKVYVYYKYVQQGGAFLGGVTFRTALEEIGPGETAAVEAGHFSEGISQVVMVEIAE